MTKRVELLYDYASPFAYIASETLAERLEGIEVDHVPIYIRGLEYFSKGVPFTAAKMKYIVDDLHRVARHHGVEIRVPSVFPVNGLYALRGALVAQDAGRFDEYHRRLFRATWAEDANIGDRAVIIELASKLGLDAADFAQRLASDDVKQRLRANTERAVERGVFGVPSFFVDDELFWGQDRVDYVRRAARA